MGVDQFTPNRSEAELHQVDYWNPLDDPQKFTTSQATTHTFTLNMPMKKKVTSYVVERPKTPKLTWNALRAHVIRRRMKTNEFNQRLQRLQVENQRLDKEKKEQEDQLRSMKIMLEHNMLEQEQKLVSLQDEKKAYCAELKKVVYKATRDDEPDSTTSPKREGPGVGFHGYIGPLDLTFKAPSSHAPQAGSSTDRALTISTDEETAEWPDLLLPVTTGVDNGVVAIPLLAGSGNSDQGIPRYAGPIVTTPTSTTTSVVTTTVSSRNSAATAARAILQNNGGVVELGGGVQLSLEEVHNNGGGVEAQFEEAFALAFASGCCVVTQSDYASPRISHTHN